MHNVVDGRTGSVVFRPRARLIRLLGEELISDEVMAVVEIVKNSYDADARTVHIDMSNITDPAIGIITVRDDGRGMSLDRVLYTWMEPATTHKRGRNGVKRRTPLGRIQLGEKGVGRFAADKLGMEMELVTREEGGAEEIVVIVNWHYFDYDSYLDEVECIWSVREPVEFCRNSYGTRLTIRSLRAAWDTGMITRLHNGLARLVAPSASITDFAITVSCSEFPLVSGVVVNRLVETAPYRLAGHVNCNGVMTLPGEQERQIDLRKLNPGQFIATGGELRTPVCGPFTVALNIWDLEPFSGKGFGVSKALRDSIKSSSGVSIYRDGFRIWPYGEKDDDWLELNQRRVNNPTLRVSNNQVIGFVEITHAENADLRDRTSREGLIDNQALYDLKVLVLVALSELETRRFAIRHQTLKSKNSAPAKEDDRLLDVLQKAQGTVAFNGQSMKAFLQEVEKLYRERMQEERARYDQVSRLAGVGMAAELLTDSFSHEVLNATTLLRTLQGEVQVLGNEDLEKLVNNISQKMGRINEQLDVMGPLYRPNIHDNGPVPIRSIVYDTVSLLSGRLRDTHTRVTLVEEGLFEVRMNRAHLIQVLMTLIENAIQAMQDGMTEEPRILIEIGFDEASCGLRISDSGPGIAENIRKLVFQPYYSTRQAGRGLGLHVASDILAGYNSTIQLSTAGGSLGGACFEIRFDGRRAFRE